MKLSLIFPVLSLLFTAQLQSQCSDEVQAIVTELHNRLNSSNGYQINFELEQSYVGETPDVQKGILTVNGSKFKLDLPQQKFISDGQQLYIVIDEAKEIQILSLGEETGLANLSPIAILEQYCKDDYVSRNLGPAEEDNREVFHYEFSPQDKNDEIFKIRVSFDQSNNEIYRVKTFSKDGSRMTLTAHSYNLSPNITSTTFTCNPSDFEGYNVEDLR